MALPVNLPPLVVTGFLLLPVMLITCIVGIGIGLATVSATDALTLSPSFQIAGAAFIIAIVDASVLATYWFRVRK